MPRARNAKARRRRRKKVLKLAKGFYGQRSKSFRRANETVMRALQYSYRDRKARKRDFRRLWIQRINAAARVHGMSYSQLIHGLREAQIEVDRKVLADLAVHNPEAFAAVVEKARQAI